MYFRTTVLIKTFAEEKIREQKLNNNLKTKGSNLTVLCGLLEKKPW